VSPERELPEIPLSISTPRLSLRAPHPDYAEAMNDAIRDSFEELRAWMNWAQQMPTLEESRAQQLRARHAFDAREDLQLVLFHEDRLVGSSGLHQIDWNVPRFEIGYWARTPDSGKGFITEAVQAIESFAFDQLGALRVQICTHTDNARSRSVPERLGYDLEGILRNDCLHVDGTPRDTAVYAKIRRPAGAADK
jgi:RimJ/RimL family protein N-acetyltransferase